MSTQPKHPTADDDFDPELEALLSPVTAGSIVDNLLALSGSVSDAEDSDPWSRAVNTRLESVLVERMRALIRTDRRDAA